MFERFLFERLLSRVHHFNLSIEGDDNPGGGSGSSDASPTAGSLAPTTGGDTTGGAAGARTSLADLGDTSDTPVSPASWPEDWRDKLTGGDEAGLAILKRMGSPEDMYKKLLAQEQTIRRGAHKAAPTLPDGATEEQVAEYRKALGVPETFDGYGIAFSPEFKPTEADNVMLQGFLADMHGRHVPTAQAKAAFDWYQGQAQRMREEAEANFQREFAQTKTELKREYGADYLRNVKLVEELMESHPGIGDAVLTNRHNKSFMRDMIALARANADEESLFGGDGQGGGSSIDDQIAAYREKAVSGKRLSQAEDKKYNDLLAARIARDNRRAAKGA